MKRHIDNNFIYSSSHVKIDERLQNFHNIFNHNIINMNKIFFDRLIKMTEFKPPFIGFKPKEKFMYEKPRRKCK